MNESADALVLFGISGDLARKMLFSALYHLTEAGRLDLPVVGVASTDWDDATLVEAARSALVEGGEDLDDGVFDHLAGHLGYVEGDYRDPSTYSAISERLGEAKRPVFYLAIPPDLFDDVVEGIAAAGFAGDGRLVVEKPFGRDARSAAELNEVIGRHFDEDQVYRIDHFLGKEAVQNLMIFRFANTILEPLWNRHFIRRVELTLAEDFGVEERGPFYDDVGAIRDVVQNHLLQMLSLMAMEPPVSDHPDALRDERVKVLRAVRSLTSDDVVRGQYRGYRTEPGVADGSTTETFVAARLEVDSWRWAGVPWIIRTGKRLERTVTEAVVEFQAPPRPLFADDACEPGPNRLTFRSKPDHDISLSMQAKVPGPELVSGPTELHLQHGRDPGRGAYERLIGDALDGDPAMFARMDGVAEAWRIVEPVLDVGSPVAAYEPGTWGPDARQIREPFSEWLTR